MHNHVRIGVLCFLILSGIFLFLNRPSVDVGAGREAAVQRPFQQTTLSNRIVQYVTAKRLDPKYDWKQPVRIRGRIVDEKGGRIARAKIIYSCNTRSGS